MSLSTFDKNQIQLINQQVILLQKKNATDHGMIETLIDFVPDVKCLIENNELSEIQVYLSSMLGFAYFVSLLSV